MTDAMQATWAGACRCLCLQQLPSHACRLTRPSARPHPSSRSNLVFLKHYSGDVADLGLTFTITDNVLGVAREVGVTLGGSVAAPNLFSGAETCWMDMFNVWLQQP